MAEQALLGLLRGGPQHGYELHQAFAPEQPLGRVYYLGMSQMYGLLKRLEARGYLESRTEPQGTRPPKVIFRLTEAGRAAFEQWLRAPVRKTRDIRLEFLAKLYFASQASAAAVDALIDVQIAVLRAELARWQAEEQSPPAADPFYHCVVASRAQQTEAAIAWMERCRQHLVAVAPLAPTR